MSDSKQNGIGLTIATIFIIPLVLLISALIDMPAIKIGVLMGIIAYGFILANILFTTQAAKIGPAIGFQRYSLFHILTGTGIIVLALCHKLIINSDGQGIVPLLGNIGFWTLIIVFIFSFLFMSNLTKQVSFLNSISQSLGRNVKVWLHRLNVVAAIAIFFHVVSNPFLREKVLFILVFLIVSIGVFAVYFTNLYKKLLAK